MFVGGELKRLAKLAIVAVSVTDDCVVVVVGVVVAPPVSACAAKAIMFSVPPVEVALNPETKLSVLWVPLRTFRPSGVK